MPSPRIQTTKFFLIFGFLKTFILDIELSAPANFTQNRVFNGFEGGLKWVRGANSPNPNPNHFWVIHPLRNCWSIKFESRSTYSRFQSLVWGRVRKKHQLAASTRALTRDWTCNLGIKPETLPCTGWCSNQQPHWPGLEGAFQIHPVDLLCTSYIFRVFHIRIQFLKWIFIK